MNNSNNKKCEHGFFLDPNGYHIYPSPSPSNVAVPMKDADKVYNITKQEIEKPKTRVNEVKKFDRLMRGEL